MAENKELLNNLLDFVTELSDKEGNEWFREELALRVFSNFEIHKGLDTDFVAFTKKGNGSVDRLIEKGVLGVIDYSEIQDDVLRAQLTRDCIEMAKVRLSKYSETISFETFCKYAHFQNEALINYIFKLISKNDLNEAVKFCADNNPKFEQNKGFHYRSINSISFIIKLFALKNYLKWKSKDSFLLQYIANNRNAILHRGTFGGYKSKIILMEVPEEDRDKDWHYRYFQFNENFDEIYVLIQNLTNTVIKIQNL